MEVSGQLHAPAALPGKITLGTHWLGGWMDPRACLGTMKKRKILPLPGMEPSSPARSPSLYRLSYSETLHG
jgi:hypothetical protein